MYKGTSLRSCVFSLGCCKFATRLGQALHHFFKMGKWRVDQMFIRLPSPWGTSQAQLRRGWVSARLWYQDPGGCKWQKLRSNQQKPRGAESQKGWMVKYLEELKRVWTFG